MNQCIEEYIAKEQDTIVVKGIDKGKINEMFKMSSMGN